MYTPMSTMLGIYINSPSATSGLPNFSNQNFKTQASTRAFKFEKIDLSRVEKYCYPLVAESELNMFLL